MSAEVIAQLQARIRELEAEVEGLRAGDGADPVDYAALEATAPPPEVETLRGLVRELQLENAHLATFKAEALWTAKQLGQRTDECRSDTVLRIRGELGLDIDDQIADAEALGKLRSEAIATGVAVLPTPPAKRGPGRPKKAAP